MDTPQRDLVSQIADIERAYGGKVSWQREVEAQNTQLAYEHWLVARTPDFKAEFGDWEAKRGVSRIDSIIPPDLSKLTSLSGKEEIKKIFHEFGSIRNLYDGREILFPTSIAGKIDSHKGFEMRSIATSFSNLFTESVPMLSELEEVRKGHKIHTSNILGFSHYAGRFKKDGNSFYIRFTVESLKERKIGSESNQLHSAFVSAISIYEYSAEPPSSAWGQVNLVITGSSAGITRYNQKLATWLAAGKREIAPNGQILEAREPTNDEVKIFLEQQRFRIPLGRVTLPLSSESEKLMRIANTARKLRKHPIDSPEKIEALQELEGALNSLNGPGLTAIPLKRIAIAFSTRKCSDKKLREACLAHENSMKRAKTLGRTLSLGGENGRGIEL